MLPTLKPGQDVSVLCWFYKIQIGDLVVFKKNGRDMIKRVQKIHQGKLFVLGDNPKASTDSRKFGWIDQDQISGKVIWY